MENEKSCISEDNHWWFASRTRALLATMDSVLPGRDLKLLDVGCGAGNMIHHLSRYGQVKGLEIDPRPVAVAHQRGYDVEQGDATQGIPFDDVEILYTESASYLPLIYEIASCLSPGGHESLPVTFAEGILTRYSRPARALKGWLSWIWEEFPQSTMARMIQDGLLEVSDLNMKAYGFDRLAAVFRAVPIGQGKDRYLQSMDREIIRLERICIIAASRITGLRDIYAQIISTRRKFR